MAYRLAKSLETLRAQIDKQWPKRRKASDGWIGDTAHRKRKSDHNPNSAGIVTALDITHDPARGVDCNKLAEALKTDTRIKYVIWNRKKWNPSIAQSWRTYTGSNPHTKHVHFSVRADKASYDSASPWKIGDLAAVVPTVPAPAPSEAILGRPTLRTGDKGQHVRNLQERLKVHGHDLAIDGDFGTKTELAVRAFQKAEGLGADGIAGQYTWAELDKPPSLGTPVKDNPTIGMERFQTTHQWPPHHAAAFIGRAQQEAHPDIRTGVLGDAETAFGGWQWRLSRRTMFYKFADDHGTLRTDWPTQIDFVPQELSTTEKRPARMLAIADTLEKACAAAMAYCRPAGFKYVDPAKHGWPAAVAGAAKGHGWGNTVRNAEALMKK
jgi:hypothetical protein